MTASTPEQGNSIPQDFNHVSVAMHIGVGDALKVLAGTDDHTLEVDIDWNQLSETLRGIGEFADGRGSAVELVIVPTRKDEDPLGHADVVYDEQGVITSRRAVIPLIDYESEINGNQRTVKIGFDPDRISRTVVHELKHVVDFDDAEMMTKQRSYMNKVRRQEQKDTNLINIALAAIGATALTVDVMGIKNIVDEEYVVPTILFIGAYTGTFAYAIKKYISLASNIGKHYSKMHRLESPIEVRAYAYQNSFNDDSIPRIVKLLRKSRVDDSDYEIEF